MSGIQSGHNYSANQINAFSRKDVDDLKQSAGTAQGFAIKGKHYKYTVTVNNQGDVHVSVKKPWYTTKGKDQWATTKAGNLRQAVIDRTDHFTDLDTTGTRGAKQVFDTITPLLQKNQHNDPEVAVYGKGMRVEVLEAFKAKGIKAVTIDKYNASVGIGWYEAHQDLAPGLLTKLRAGDLSKNLTPQNDVSDTRRLAWAKYLEKNVDRLDVLAKCKSLAQKNDDGDSLAQFIVKNCPPDALEAGLQKKIKDAPDRETKLNHIKETDLFKQIVTAAADNNHKIPLNTKGFDSVMQIAFFRTTSKMGVEFFASQKMPIAFWSAELGDEKEVLAPMNPDPMKLKPWKQLDNRDVGNGTQRAESITYSEMRYVARLRTDLVGVQSKGRSTHMAPFKPKNLQVVPVLIKDLEGKKFVELHADNSPV